MDDPLAADRAKLAAKRSAAERTAPLFTDSGPLFGSKGATREAKENEILSLVPGALASMTRGPQPKVDKNRAEREKLTGEIVQLEEAAEQNAAELQKHKEQLEETKGQIDRLTKAETKLAADIKAKRARLKKLL